MKSSHWLLSHDGFKWIQEDVNTHIPLIAYMIRNRYFYQRTWTFYPENDYRFSIDGLQPTLELQKVVLPCERSILKNLYGSLVISWILFPHIKEKGENNLSNNED